MYVNLMLEVCVFHGTKSEIHFIDKWTYFQRCPYRVIDIRFMYSIHLSLLFWLISLKSPAYKFIGFIRPTVIQNLLQK